MTGLIVHEWIARSGGSERVVDQVARMFPDADIQCLWNEAGDRYPGHVTRETVLARTPLRRSKALALPVMPLVWRTVRGLSRYDWMLVSSHLFAHHVAPVREGVSVPAFVYVHTPARYLWEPSLDVRGDSRFVRSVSPIFRSIDARRARAGGKVFAANSSFTRDRIRRSWGVDARVIYPPVDVRRLSSVPCWSDRLRGNELKVFKSLPDHFILGASRFVSYKRLDVAVNAGAASRLPVVIAGSGPEEQRLRRIADQAGIRVEFILEPSDTLMAALMQAALVYVFAAIEDFGIMPVEAMSLGTPVIVNHLGGAAETVDHLRTGLHLAEPSSMHELARAVELAAGMSSAAARERALLFSNEVFEAGVKDWLSQSVPGIV